MMERKDVFIHPTADVSDEAVVGEGTRIWHQAQVREKAEIGVDCVIGKNVYIDFSVKIGSRVKIQNNVSVYHGVTIEDEVFIGPSATFTNDISPRSKYWSDDKVVGTLVKKGASVGANSTIVCGVVLGESAMVGAGSVVTRDVPAHALVYGNPARVRGFVCECGGSLGGGAASGDVVLECAACGKKVTIKKEVYEMKK